MRKNIMTFANLSNRVQNVFSSEENYDGYRNLMFDLAVGNDIFDADDNKINRADAEKQLRKLQFAVLGINENSSKRDRKRALKKHGAEWFEVIEEVIDFKVETGWRETEFFNQFVEERNLARGDRNEFWTEDDVILSVSKVAGDHHDFHCRIRIV